ncbi:MAG: type I methionyl aminopeptidase [Candidatus Cloacimonetes bacterium]|nr:type I methionyl aminopeptidase [Candidatus Cloacimonadota bacterium]
MIIIKNKEQIEGIKKACILAKECLFELEKKLFIGQNTEKINSIAHKFMTKNKGIPATLNYNGFPKSLCTSINHVVCHGIPSKKDVLKNGDIINLDVTVILNGYFGDTSKTFIIGEVSEDVKLFVERAERAMYKGIKMLKPGILLSQMGKTIESYALKFGYSVVKDYGGHGTGLSFHEDPHVCNFYSRTNNILLKEGMIFTVEPMINKSKNYQVETSTIDNWTVTTKDKSLSAQFEHTVLITRDSHEILTI